MHCMRLYSKVLSIYAVVIHACRQVQEMSVRPSEEKRSPSISLRGSWQPDFVMHLPNTLISRLIARNPRVSRKLIDDARLSGVEVQFNETELCYQALLYGADQQAQSIIQTQLQSLDRELQTKLEISYQQMHCAILPLLLDPNVSKVLADIEMKHHVSIHIADNCGTIASIGDFIRFLHHSLESCDGKLLTTADLKNISAPAVHINVNYIWKVKNEGAELSLPNPVNKYLNDTFFTKKLDIAEFEFNGRHYVANVSLMSIREVETGLEMVLNLESVPPQWSYAISDEEFVSHEPQDSSEIENMFRYGGSSITLAGSKHMLDLKTMHQVDLETGQRLAVKRDPSLACLEAPQYFVTFAIRGLQRSLRPACRAMQRKLLSFCIAKPFIADLHSTIPKHWQDIIVMRSLNTARQYCLKIEQHTLDAGKMTIQMRGDKEVIDKVQALLMKQCFECQTSITSRLTPAPTPPEKKYPSEWEPQQSDFELFRVHRRSREWQYVNGLMKQSLANFKIIELQRIQNQQLWEGYAFDKKRMSKCNNGAVNEKNLFHGTREANPKLIIKSVKGIDFRYSRRDYKLLWGAGAYFAVKAQYSDRYCYYDSSSGTRQLLLVKVLTGRSYNYGATFDPSLTKPPPLPENRHMLYDTVKGFTNDSYVYVVYDHNRAYPAYLITYIVTE